jgi:hypothetical protein
VADYQKATNFTAKDGLPSGNAGKIVKGTEIDTELTAVSNAIASKADINSPTFTGTPAGPTASSGTNTTQFATTAFVTAALQAVYPVGSIYINATSASNPNTLLGFGTWTAFGAGRVMVGLDAGDALFDTAEETGGSKDAITVSHSHTATVTDPQHSHSVHSSTWSGSVTDGLSSADSIAGRNLTATAYYANGNSSTPFIEAASTGVTVANSTTGSSGTNANVQPFIVVRMWKRTA